MTQTSLFTTAVLAACLPAVASAALPPAGTHFSLNVTSSFEKPFTDCWTFATNGRFIHSTSLKNFPYQLDNLNRAANAWQAIWIGRVSIAFSGAINGTNLTGNGIDANTRTYSFTGTQVASCPAAKTPAVSGWRQ